MRDVERMVPAGIIDGREYWVRAEVAADHPGRTYGPLDTHFLWAAADLESEGYQRDGDEWVCRWERTGLGWVMV